MAGSSFYKRPVKRALRQVRKRIVSPKVEDNQPEKAKTSVATEDLDSQFDDIAKNYNQTTPLGDMESRAAQGAPESPEAGNNLSPKQIKTAEAKPQPETSWYNLGKKDEDKPRVVKVYRKRKVLVSSGVTLVLITSVWGTGIITGPLQAIFASQFLSGVHLYDFHTLNNARLLTLMRYMRDPNKPQNARMGIIANALADRVEKKFNASGISSSYTRGMGYLNGYTIDPDKMGGDLSELRGKSGAEITDYFKTNYQIDLKPHPHVPGKLYAPVEGLSLLQKRKLSRTMIKISGYNGLAGSLTFRIMVPRNGIRLHLLDTNKALKAVVDPIGAIQDEVIRRGDAKYTQAQHEKDREKYAQTGAEPPNIPTVNAADGENEGAVGNADALAEASENAQTQGSGTPEQRAEYEKNMKLKIAGTVGIGVIHGASALDFAGLVCTVKFLAAQFDKLKMASVVMPLMRIAMEVVSNGDQVRDGFNADMEQLGWYVGYMYNEADGTNFMDNRPAQHVQGDPLSAPPDPPEVRIDPEGNVLTKVTNSIPGLDGICTVLDNAAISGGLTVLGFIGGPVTASIGLAAGVAIQQYLPQILASLAGSPIDIVGAQGAKYGAYAMYGARYAGNDARASMGGIPQPPEVEMEVMAYKDAVAADEFKSQNLAYRLFNMHDRRSLAASLVMKQSLRPTSFVASASGILNAFSLPGKLFGQIFTSRVSAAAPTPYDYGSPYIGESLAEASNPVTENGFANAGVVMGEIIAGANGQRYIDRAKICNGMSINSDGSVKSTGQPLQISDINNPANGCADRSLEWLRVRTYIKDTEIMEGLACWEGDETGCNNLEYGNGNTAPAATQPAATPGVVTQ